MLNEMITAVLPLFAILFFFARHSYLKEVKNKCSNPIGHSYRFLSNSELNALTTLYPTVTNQELVYYYKGKVKKSFSIPYSNSNYYNISSTKLLILPQMEKWLKPNDINVIEFIFIGLKAVAVNINGIDTTYLVIKEQNNRDWLAGKIKKYTPSYNEMVKSGLKNQGISEQKIKQNDTLNHFFYQVTETRLPTRYEAKAIRAYKKNFIGKTIGYLFISTLFLVLLQSTLFSFLFYIWLVLASGSAIIAFYYLIKSRKKQKDRINKLTGTITNYDIKKQQFELNSDLIITYPLQWQNDIISGDGKTVTIEVSAIEKRLVSYNEQSLENEKKYYKNYDLPLLATTAKMAMMILVFGLTNVASYDFTDYIDNVHPALRTKDSERTNNTITLERAKEAIYTAYKKQDLIKFEDLPAICIKNDSSNNCATILVVNEDDLKHYLHQIDLEKILGSDKVIINIFKGIVNNSLIKYDETNNKITNLNELESYTKNVCTSYLIYKSSECKELESIIRRIKFDNASVQDMARYAVLLKGKIASSLKNAILPSTINSVDNFYMNNIKHSLIINIEGKPLLPGIKVNSSTTHENENLFNFYLHLLNTDNQLTTPISFSARIISIDSKIEADAYVYQLYLSSKALNKQNQMEEDISMIRNRIHFSLIVLLLISIPLAYLIFSYLYIWLRSRKN